MATQQDVIKSFMAALDKTTLKGTAAVDAAIRASSKFQSAQDVINNMISDRNSAGSGDSFLRNYCGIILDNTDTGAITGSDAGGSTTKTAESIVPESGALKTFTGDSFTVNGLTFTLEKSFKNLSAKEQFIWQGLYTWWAKGALNLIKTSYGYSFTDSDVHFKKVTVSFKEDSSTTHRAENHWYDTNDDGKVDKVTLMVNMRYYKNIDTTNPNGYSSTEALYLDKTIAHELTHTIMYAKILNSQNYSGFIKEGLAELTIGIDDERESAINLLAKNSSTLKNNLNGTSTSYDDSAGYMFFRYFANQASLPDIISNTKTKANVMGTANADTIENRGANSTINALGGNDFIGSYAAKSSINAGDGNDTINNTNKGTNVTILGGGGNDSIRNSASAKIDGGAGNDTLTNTDLGGKATLFGGAGKDYITTYNADNVSISGGDDADKIELLGTGKLITVSGGKGNDTISIAGGTALIQYAAGDGNDVIQGVTKADTISISGSEYTSSVKGNDVVLGVGTGSVTLKGAKNIAFTVKGTLIPDPNPDNPKLITGTAGNDSINNSISGATINALGGNDRVYNTGTKTQIYAGADKFIYASGDGKDIIFGFDNSDILQITGTSSATYNKSKNTIAFTVDSTANAITLKDFTATTFNINGDKYRISGTKLVK